MPEWESAGTDEPRDKQRDLDVPGFWALIGPDWPDGYGWTVIDPDGEDVAMSKAADEAAAMQAVADWEFQARSLIAGGARQRPVRTGEEQCQNR